MCSHISNFYLNNLIDRCEYIKLPLQIVPAEIIQNETIRLSTQSLVYMEIQRIMFGLSQAGKISNDKLKQHLAKFVYETAPSNPGLWQHQIYPL